MNDILTLLSDNNYFQLITAIIALASAIAALTGTPKKGSKLYYVYKVIDFLALNIGKAKDKAEKAGPKK